MENKNRLGWVRVCGDDLSQFHRQLIQIFPKYASAAVSECMLPGSPDALPYEERVLLPSVWSSVPHSLPQTLYRGDEPSIEKSVVVVDSHGAVVGREIVATEKPMSPEQIAERLSQLRAFPWTLAHAVEGKAGEVKIFEIHTSYTFLGKRIRVDDSFDGRGTRVGDVFVDGKFQPRASMLGCLTREANDSYKLAASDQLLLSTCGAGRAISIRVEFIKDCRFTCTIEGKAVG